MDRSSQCQTVPRLSLAGVVVLFLLAFPLRTTGAAGVGQPDQNIVVVLTSPQPGAHVQGDVRIAGYAADRRASIGSGLNDNDIRLYVDDDSTEASFIGYAGSQHPSPDAATTLGPQFNLVGFERIWHTCSLPPGTHDLIIWVSSLVSPGARGALHTDVEVDPCPAGADQPPISAPVTASPPSPPTAPALSVYTG